jgi:hypothetical protein
MKVHLAQYIDVGGVQGVGLPIGGQKAGAGESKTAAGSFTALTADAKLIRVTTDTAIHFRRAAGADATDEMIPANGVEYFPVAGLEVCSFITA